ncbi:DUF2207 domain-containing protein [Ruminococcus sp. HUN007]|uniref:DUF2207 domain-containing protein n=1 Tax=Ruminococcus sp. HUN007 TaxID=1514668 RepID=UPI0005D1A0D6|nr:DUF2207 domain-containing protein [Ruminococcus sp. HUN007]
MKKRKTVFKSMAALIALIMTVILMCPVITVYADDKEYSVDAADFDIKFGEDGTALVEEHWTVTYKKGNFTRFYKDVYNASNQLEYISQLKIVSASINGTDCERSETLDRVDNHYYVEAQNDRFSLQWFKAAHNETVEYDIVYGIPNALKLNENNRAEFCYRLIGKNFPKTVGTVTAIVNLPYDDDTANCSISQGESDVTTNTLYFNASDVSGIYKLRLDISPEGFKNLTRVADVNVPEHIQRAVDGGEDDEISFGYIVLGFIMMAFFPVIMVYIYLIVPMKKRKKVRRMLEEDPDCFKKSADKIESAGMPFVWYTLYPFKKVFLSQDHVLVFYAELFDLCARGYFTAVPEGLRVNNGAGSICTDEVQNAMNGDFMKLLSEHFTMSEDQYGPVFYYRTMKEEFNDTVVKEIEEWRKKIQQ